MGFSVKILFRDPGFPVEANNPAELFIGVCNLLREMLKNGGQLPIPFLLSHAVPQGLSRFAGIVAEVHFAGDWEALDEQIGAASSHLF